ncbi:hypothetical protein GT755_12205 [Herbidospora sp. NEAU-GS84]|uniref:Uncharacterized protein n=1 Tax=Herbidospora solisilvae TaxID=2696284 RepID=A0A7C9JBI2_9ACTN|nr:hypothetical protein [Herbidospora solisilvae]NAS22444.1 hypothetical protein [Herbidospora solisilvae]
MSLFTAHWERLSGPIEDLTTRLPGLRKTKRTPDSVASSAADAAVATPEFHADGSGTAGGHPEGSVTLAGARTPRERLVVLAEEWVCGTFDDVHEAELRELMHESISASDLWGMWAYVIDSIRRDGPFDLDSAHAQFAIDRFLEGGE